MDGATGAEALPLEGGVGILGARAGEGQLLELGVVLVHIDYIVGVLPLGAPTSVLPEAILALGWGAALGVVAGGGLLFGRAAKLRKAREGGRKHTQCYTYIGNH